MRVAVLTTSFPRRRGDDAGIFVERLVAALADIGITGVVVVPYDGDEPLRDQRKGFEIRRYRYGMFSKGRLAFGEGIVPRIKSRPALALQIPGLLLVMAYTSLRIRADFDVMHANWVGAGVAAWLASLLSGRPYILTVRGEDVRLLCHPVIGALLAPVVRRAGAITSVNQQFVTKLQERFSLPEGRVQYIPNGVSLRAVSRDELAVFRERKRLSADKRYLLFVGTLIPRKRVEWLVELIARLPQHFELLLCGRLENEHYVDSIRELTATRRVSDRVHFEGMVPPDEIALYLEAAYCFVSASEYEGRPNALLEAIAAGRPVLVSDIPAHREVVANSAAVLFDGNTLEEAARRLLSENITTVGRELPAWSEAARQFAELFKSVLVQSSARG